MNYIKQLNAFMYHVETSPNLNPTHISLYMALFQSWNKQRFRNPFQITREEIMMSSKIASKATYHKCIKELVAAKLIIYEPSYNPFRGSAIQIIQLFDDAEISKNRPLKRVERAKVETEKIDFNDDLNSSSASSNKSTEPVKLQCLNFEQAVGHIDEHLVGQINEPIIINKNKQKKQSKHIVEQTQKKTETKNTIFLPPTLIELKTFFAQTSYPEEYQKFFNHFESNGWLIGGKSKMKNWQAAARNWLLNAQKFNPHPAKQLQTNENKSYSIPL